MINSYSQNMFTFHFSSARLVKHAHLSTHSTSARLNTVSYGQKEWKMTSWGPTMSICYSCFAKPAACLKQPWSLVASEQLLISDLCFWSGCLLICRKCVSGSVRYDLIRQHSPLFSSGPISWYGRKGSSVVIFPRSPCCRVRFRRRIGPGDRVRWCKETHKRSAWVASILWVSTTLRNDGASLLNSCPLAKRTRFVLFPRGHLLFQPLDIVNLYWSSVRDICTGYNVDSYYSNSVCVF